LCAQSAKNILIPIFKKEKLMPEKENVCGFSLFLYENYKFDVTNPHLFRITCEGRRKEVFFSRQLL